MFECNGVVNIFVPVVRSRDIIDSFDFQMGNSADKKLDFFLIFCFFKEGCFRKSVLLVLNKQFTRFATSHMNMHPKVDLKKDILYCQRVNPCLNRV